MKIKEILKWLEEETGTGEVSPKIALGDVRSDILVETASCIEDWNSQRQPLSMENLDDLHKLEDVLVNLRNIEAILSESD